MSKKKVNPDEYGENARQFIEITTKSLQEIMSQFIKDVYEITSIKPYLTYSLKFNKEELHALDTKSSELPNIKNYRRQMKQLPKPILDDIGVERNERFDYQLWNKLMD